MTPSLACQRSPQPPVCLNLVETAPSLAVVIAVITAIATTAIATVGIGNAASARASGAMVPTQVLQAVAPGPDGGAREDDQHSPDLR